MDEPGNADAQNVKHNHGRGEDAHVHDVGGGCDDGRNDEDDQDGVAEVAPVVRKNLCKSECASSWCRSRLFSGIVPKNSVRRSCFVRS